MSMNLEIIQQRSCVGYNSNSNNTMIKNMEIKSHVVPSELLVTYTNRINSSWVMK